MTDLLTDPPAAPTVAPTAPPPAVDPPAVDPAKAAADAAALASKLAPDPNADFMKTLPEDLRENGSLKRYSSTESLARAYVNLEKTLASDKVPVPKDPGDTEAWDRYYKAGGRPEAPEKYEIAKPEKLPEGVTWDDGMESWWRSAAFEAGLNNRQAAKLVDQYRDRFVAGIDAGNQKVSTDLTAAKAILQRDWGTEYEARRALAKAAFAEMPEDARKQAVESGLARMPSFVKYLYDIRAKTTGERQPRPPGESAETSPQAIRDRISALRTQHGVALGDMTHPDHTRLVAELQQLHEKLYPMQAAS